MTKPILLALALTLAACSATVSQPGDDGSTGEAGATVTAPCDQQAALDAFRAARAEEGQVGEWVISADCVVTQVAR